MQVWIQNYNPLGNSVLSTAVAALPVTLLFYLLAVRRLAAHWSAVWAFACGVVVALVVFRMPAGMLAAAVGHGFVYAALRIAWILVAAVFIYDLTVESGHFETIKASIGGITDDRRLQALLIALAFGAVLEGAGGGGAPVAVCGAMMIGLGFKPFETAVMCLLANTAPVAFGGMGNPVRTLVAVTGLAEPDLAAMTGRIVFLTALILPLWLVRTMTGWRNTLRVWPGLAVCGIAFAGTQLFWSNCIDGTLVNVVGGMFTLLLCAVFFRFWQPAPIWRYPEDPPVAELARNRHTTRQVLHAWSPFLLLAVFVVLWGLPSVKHLLESTDYRMPAPGLHNMVLRTPPIVPRNHPEPAIMELAWLSTIGTGTFLAGLLAGPILGLSLGRTLRVFGRTNWRLRYSLLAIVAMICLGFVTRYCGMDAILGLAMTNTGWLYPMFGTLIGWLGTAMSGTDAGSNALFGSLQVITANKLGLSPVLMAAANTAGGVMGKMIGAQSVIVACVATGLEGKEGDVFRAVVKHSIALTLLVGLIVMFFAYAAPGLVPNGHKWW
ncbi:MAG: L-lactate permease [Bryobacteraceae bacterium]